MAEFRTKKFEKENEFFEFQPTAKPLPYRNTKMANPRQRRKSRSSTTTKPSLNAKRAMKKKLARAPTVKGADVLKEAWDGKLTARQNYAKLGLVPSLDVRPNSGGVEQSNPTHPSHSLKAAGSIPASVDRAAKTGRKGMARIVRDTDGNIIDIIEADDNDADSSTPWGAPLPDLADAAEVLETYMPVQRELQRGEKPNQVVADLETLAAEATPVERHTSHIESDWLLQLVAKHGSDTEAMSKDVKFNPWQKTKGQIARAIKKAGGIESLQSQ